MGCNAEPGFHVGRAQSRVEVLRVVSHARNQMGLDTSDNLRCSYPRQCTSQERCLIHDKLWDKWDETMAQAVTPRPAWLQAQGP
jgi:hypothetical protein